jgi:DNA-binding CsgD family transcriptional regulator
MAWCGSLTEQRLVRRLASALSARESAWTIPIRPSEGRRAHVAHRLPVRGLGRDVFSSLDSILVIVPVNGGRHLHVELLRGLFDLTAAEAKVANAIIAGRTVGDVALDVATSINTVRFHLKNVMVKTGTTRQAELVALLANVPIPASARQFE